MLRVYTRVTGTGVQVYTRVTGTGRPRVSGAGIWACGQARPRGPA